MGKIVNCGPADNGNAILASCGLGDTFRVLNGVTLAKPASRGILWQVADGAQVAVTDPQIDGTGLTNAQLAANGGAMIFVGGGMHNSKWTGGKISNCPGAGFGGHPGNGNTFDGIAFEFVNEPIHFNASCDGLSITNVVVTHATRIAFELQEGMTNLTVTKNRVTNWLPHIENGIDSHMACSCATGGHGPPWVGFGENITIADNVFVQEDQRDIWAKSAIEIMGTGPNMVIARNYCNGWGAAVLNGAMAPGAHVSGNTVVGGALVAGDRAEWPIAPIQDDGTNKVYAYNDPNAPLVPGTVPPIPIPPMPSLIVATPGKDPGTLALAFPMLAVARPLAIFPTQGASQIVQLGNLPAGCTGAIVGPVPLNWEVTATLGGAPSNNVQITTGTATTWAPKLISTLPPVVPPVPVPTPIVVKTLVINTSLDNGKTWTAQSTIQP